MFQHPNQILDVVRGSFHRRRILVIGDLMLDRYLWGAVERISPEAPVPVVRIEHRTHSGGGAANVAANLNSLGCQTSLAGTIGEDEDGRQLLDIIRSSGIETGAILAVQDRPTTCKTRILGGRQQMLRLDVEDAEGIGSSLGSTFLAAVEAQIPGSSAVILSDYGKGLLSEFVCQTVIRRAHGLGVPVFVDPKGLSYENYSGSDLISPNRSELAAAVSTSAADLELLLKKGQRLRSQLGIGALAVTLSELGIALLEADGVRRFPAVAREVFDVSGAGDTVIATIAAAVAAGLHLHDAVRLANLAAGTVIAKLGTMPVSSEELQAALALDSEASRSEKICSQETLLKRAAQWRIAGRRIVFTNGCFDLLHVGHLALLQQARQEGDCLIVALNTDRSVRALRGAGRPVISEDARVNLVAALPCVDAVVLFDEETPTNLIRVIRPDVLVKGADYSEEEVVGANEMKAWGGRVALIPLIEGFSTTAILKRAIASAQDLPRPAVQ
jgi:D-beta-D-heptose 7-phosphate kinase / D-beta-D-heptose 1-phosphate adenosyltransferase